MSASTAALPPLAGAEPAAAVSAAAAGQPQSAQPGAMSMASRRAWLQQASRLSIPAARLVAWIDVQVMLTAAMMTGALAPRLASAPLGELLSSRIGVTDLVPIVLFAAAVLAVFEIAGLYEAALVRRWQDECRRVVLASATVAVALGLVAAVREPAIHWPALFRFWLVSSALVVPARAVRAGVARRMAGPRRRVLIVGSGPQALRICRELSTDPLTAYQIVGFVDSNPAPPAAFVLRRTVGTLDELEHLLVRQHIDEVHVGLPVKSHYPAIQDTIRVCERIGVKVMYGADIFGTELARPCVGMGLSPRVELQIAPEGPVLLVKRAIDIVATTVLLVALAPVLLAAAIAIKLTSDGPVFFAQERYGHNRRRFRMLKFRTMVVGAEQMQAALESLNEVEGPHFKIARDPRITPIGGILRRTSIDELPQLFNVLRGDMSLVGPRPMAVRDVHRFTRTGDMRRFSVTPGITGLWQVSGRTRLTFDEWIRLDLHYIDTWSLLLDFRILARTLPAVVRGTGAA